MEEVEVNSMTSQEIVEEKLIVTNRLKELEQSLEDKERVSHEWYCSLNVSGIYYDIRVYNGLMHY